MHTGPGCRWEELISLMMIHADALLLDVCVLLNLTYAMPIPLPGLGLGSATVPIFKC